MASNPPGRPGQLPSPPNANSPLSPGSASSNQISFRPNVNRAKTKRWVEAKQESYDGGDYDDGEWGGNDDEEEEEEQPPAAPRPPYATRTGSSELSSRRLSGLALGADESRRSPSVDNKNYPSGGDPKVLPVVRPADIYRRMREETTSPSSPGPGAQTEALSNPLQPNATSQVAVAGREGPTPELNLSGAGEETPAIGLPEVKRISAFGTDFLGGGDSGSQQQVSYEPPQTSLQHNPSQASQGFTSVVHQAFDVPETPNSTTGSVARSNSDGTSLISPIMSNRGLQDDKTPTIPEEPAESSTPTGNGPREAAKEGPVFIPGHRRDLSLPESDNSPSKKPLITDHELPPAGHAEMSAVSPSKPSGNDFVAPLKFGSNGNTGSEGYRGEIPTIVPASAGNSPADTDNDRLREEIMRSLSRENSQEPEVPPQQPATGGSQEDSIPRQYEKYLDGTTGPSSGDRPKNLVSESHPDWTGPHPLASRDPYVNAQAAGSEAQVAAEPSRPKLGRRFSWESASSAGNPAAQIPGSYSSPPPLSAALANQEPEPIPDGGALEETSKEPIISDSDSSDGPRAERPRLSIVPPIPENSSPPEQIMGPVDAPGSPKEPLPSNVGMLSLDESKLKGFRDILNMTSPNERIRAFDQTRDQFAALDTGLNHWLQVTINDNPDHFDIVQQSRSLSSGFPRPSPSRAKLPKLGSLGNLSASREDGTPTSATHIRRPSGHLGTIVNRQNVGERGKEFLHTAGAFGGKAGEAAKGLFAKGRSKLRPSGGDKGQSTTARRSLHFSFASESNGSNGNSALRNSVNLGNLPMFKFGAGKDSATKEQGDSQEERAGKRFKSDEAMDHDNTPGAARRQSEGFDGKSDFAGDLEQEMNAALGLSPTEARSKQPAGAEPVMSHIATAQSPHPPPLPAKNDVAAKCNDCGPAGERPSTEKDLPAPPEEHSEIPSAEVTQPSTTPGVEVSSPMPNSIRPVDDDEKPPPPPKDLPPKDAPRETALKDRASAQASHTRQPSVSTLGVDEHASHPAEGDVDDPPSPLQPSQESESDDLVDGKPLPPAKDSVQSAEENLPAFGPVSPPKTASSAQILESKRRSISGLPPSTPGIQSPLRNEVRYSPGTRSSMLSFGSFGRQSTNSKGTRPVTPANGLPQRRGSASPSLENGDSAIDKLKSFGKRRRASVGDILSGIQGNIQGGLQGLQNGGQNKDHQKKRTFSRISGFFNRSQESQPLETETHANLRASSQDLARKVPSATSSNGKSPSMSSEDKALPSPPVPGLASSLLPIADNMATKARASHRTSMPTPASTSGGNRFYSQLQAANTPTPAQHSRVKSQPMLGSEPLSPIAPSVSNQSGSSPLSNVHELDEGESQKEASEEPSVPRGSNEQEPQGEESSEQGQTNQPRQPEETQSRSEDQATDEARKSQDSVKQSSTPIHPNLSVRSRKPVGSNTDDDQTSTPKDIAVSNPSIISAHPHRDEARVLNETGDPVELALTKDDSSEEVVMSPTTYPGQEWTPMHL